MSSFNELRKQAAAKGFKGSPNPTRKQLEEYLNSLTKDSPQAETKEPSLKTPLDVAARFNPPQRLYSCQRCRTKHKYLANYDGRKVCCRCEQTLLILKNFPPEPKSKKSL